MNRELKYRLDKGLKVKEERIPLSFSLYLLSHHFRSLSFKLLLHLAFCFSLSTVEAQNISINDEGLDPDPSAMLDVSDTTRGVLVPRLSKNQRDLISNPATGLLIFQTNEDSGFYFNHGTAALPNWLRIKTAADTNLWSETDTNIFYNKGFVGIGVDTPRAHLHLYGSGSLGSGARLAFGDDYFYQGANNGLNVHIGESGWYDNIDSDQLQLHGKFGQLFTVQGQLGPSNMDTALFISSNSSIGVNTVNPISKFHVEVSEGRFLTQDFPSSSGSVLLGSWQGQNVAPNLRFERTDTSDFVDIGLDSNHNFVIQPNDQNLFTFRRQGWMNIGYDTTGFRLFLGSRSNGATFARLKSEDGQAGIWATNNHAGWALFSDATAGGLLPNGSVGLFLTNGTGLAWSVSPSGFLGVNTDSAINQLHINQDQNVAMLRLNTEVDTATAEMVFSTNNNPQWTFGGTAPNHPWGEAFFAFNIARSEPDFFIDGDNGNFGIGTTSPAYRLDVDGDINASGVVRSSGVALSSDKRFKTNIEEIKGVLPKLMELSVIYHYWDTLNYPERNFSKARALGLIAQEIQKIYPELVFEDKNGYLSLDYAKFSAILLRAIQEQETEINKLKEQVQINSEGLIELKAELKKRQVKPSNEE